MPTALEPEQQTPRVTRPLYLKKVPAAVWERVHVNAIRSGMRLTDYLVSVLASAEPVAVVQPSSAQPLTTPPAALSPANGNG